MDGWMVWFSCARYPQQRRQGKKKKSWYYPPKEMGCTVLYSRGQGGISGTAGTSGMRAMPPVLWALRCCCWRSRCSCSACIVARICNCCAMKSDVLGLKGSGGISVDTERETRALSRGNVPHPENAHDGFPTTDFFLLFLFSFAIFDSPKISL